MRDFKEIDEKRRQNITQNYKQQASNFKNKSKTNQQNYKQLQTIIRKKKQKPTKNTTAYKTTTKRYKNII